MKNTKDTSAFAGVMHIVDKVAVQKTVIVTNANALSALKKEI